MATTTSETESAQLQELAKRHLWLHFSRMGAYDRGAEVPIIVRGDGCYVWDDHGNRYLDALSALFCVNIGHGRADIAQAGADQAKELGFFTTWSYAHPRAIELAAKIASLAPGDLNRVFFTSGGGESVETALKVVRQYHKLTGNPNKTKVIARNVAYHGTTLGALSATGVTGLRAPFEPFTPGGCHVANTNLYRLPPGLRRREPRRGDRRAHRVRGARDGRRRDPRAGPERRRLLHAARRLLRARARDLRRVRRPASSPTRSSARGAASAPGSAPQRYGYQPDIITTAKGLTSSYAAMGAMIASDRIMEPFLESTNSFAHGFTFGGHPMAAAVALANIQRVRGRGHPRERAGERRRAARDARVAARHPDRRRRARRRLLPRDRARQGPRDEGELHRRTRPRRCCAATSAPSCSTAA